jgi:hypothetical protein
LAFLSQNPGKDSLINQMTVCHIDRYKIFIHDYSTELALGITKQIGNHSFLFRQGWNKRLLPHLRDSLALRWLVHSAIMPLTGH